MKSKTSCYDCATGRMELRRFAPLWVLYAIVLFLLTSLSVTRYGDTLDNILHNIRELSALTSLYNFGYAFVLAQILFGDLYNPRLCYSIHALPIPKGGWFGTQIILGIMGTLIANLLNAGLLMFMVTEYRIVALLWLVSSLLGFLCFFGIAALCAICAGNRLGILILYGLINLYDGLLAWFRLKLYASLIYGMYINDADVPLSPIYRMITNANFDIKYDRVLETSDPNLSPHWESIISDITVNSSLMWEYVIWGLVGCAAIWLAMRLYRKRKLECAGDLLAFSKMELPVLILATIAAGGVGHVCAYAFNWQLNYTLLLLGLVLGYYACLMLLKRRVNVFRLKTLAPLLVICCVLALSLLLTGLDVFGITYRMPKVEEVSSVSIHLSDSSWISREISDPETIQMVLDIQEDALDTHRQIEKNRPLLERIFGDEDGRRVGRDFMGDNGYYLAHNLAYILYTMKDGSHLNRIYVYPTDTAVIPQMRVIFSDPKAVFIDYTDNLYNENDSLGTFINQIQKVRINCNHELGEYKQSTNYLIEDSEDAKALVDAILADCEAGSMAQSRFLHPGANRVDYIDFEYQREDEFYSSNFNIYLYPGCENTYQWLIANGYHGENYDDTPIEW